MTLTEKYDKLSTGIISGFLLPVIISLVIFLFAKGDPDLSVWISRIKLSGVTTHIMSICIFPNVLIFLLFNHFDMLRACRGVLGITIVWAVLVFIVKFLT